MAAVNMGEINQFETNGFTNKNNSVIDKNDCVRCMIQLTPDDQYLIMINNKGDEYISTIYNIDNWKIIATYKQLGELNSLCFSNDGRYQANLQVNGIIMIYNTTELLF